MVLPNPEPIGSAFSHSWWLTLIVLLLFSIVFNGFSTLVNLIGSRAMKRKDFSDTQQNLRLSHAEEAISNLKVEILEQEKTYQDRLYKIQLEMAQCRQEMCSENGRWITREEHHGDILRVQELQRKESEKIVTALTELHRRIDKYFGKIAKSGTDV